MSVVVVSPHPDDAVLGCWTVLARRPTVYVVNVFAGLPAPGFIGQWDKIVGASDSRDLMRTRLAEDRDALGQLGIEPVDLPFLEAQYRSCPPPASEIAAALVDVCGSASAIYAPAAIGGHADHTLARDLAVALRTHERTVHLYAELPYATRYGWPAWVTGDEPDRHLAPDAYWERSLASVSWPRAKLRSRVVELSNAERDRKLEAVRVYRSQFAALNGGAVGLLTNSAVRGREVVWDICP